MARRRSRRSGRKPVGRWVGRVLGVAVMLLLFALGTGYLRLRAYLQSEQFRAFLATQVGQVIGIKGGFQPFRWDGLQVSTGGFDGAGDGWLAGVKADEVRTEVGLGGVRRGAWELIGASVRRLEVDLTTLAPAAAEETAVVEEQVPAPVTAKPAKRRGWIPDRVEVRELRVDESQLRVKTSDGEVLASGQNWFVKPGSVKASYDLEAAGGTLSHPWSWAPPLRIDRARLRLQGKRLSLTDATAAVYQRGRVTVAGEADFEDGGYSFEGGLENVRCDEVLPEDWKQRVKGQISCTFSVRRSGKEMVTSGKIRVKDGVLTALPVLDRLAAYSNTTRFRVLPLQEARAGFIRRGNKLALTDIILSSEGLVRLEGRMDVTGRNLDGFFRLGLAPGTLATIPGAETKVFLEQERGLLWTPLRITGTIDNPQEDLSERLMMAAGERMFELIPETGETVLKFTRSVFGDGGRGAVQQGVETVKGGVQQGGNLIRDAADTVREGVGGLFDLLPGRNQKEEEEEPPPPNQPGPAEPPKKEP